MRRFFFVFVDVPRAKHCRKHDVSSRFAFFRILKRRIIVRRFHQPRQACAFAESQFVGRFGKVKFRRAFNPETVVPEINGVEIFFEDFVFRIAFFEGKRQFQFFQFSSDRFFLRKMRVFHQLLRDCRCAFFERSCDQIVFRRPRHAFQIDSAVFVKSPVFRIDKGVFHMVGNFRKRKSPLLIPERERFHGVVVFVV